MPAYLKASIKRSYAEGFLNELESNQNQYFLFVAKSTPWTETGYSDSSPPPYIDTVKNERDVMKNIIGYKKLNPKNILFALPRYEWVSGTVYDQYSDTEELFDPDSPKQFYVITDQNHIYKCLTRPSIDGTYNGTGVASTVKPTGTGVTPVTLSDGYVWKYIATVRSSDVPYELSDYIPIDFITSSSDTETVNQYTTQVTAVDGQITRIDMISNGGVSAAVYSAFEGGTADSIRLSKYEKSVSGVKSVQILDADKVNLKQTSYSNYVGYVLRIIESTKNPQTNNNYGVITESGLTGPTNSTPYFLIKDDALDFIATNPAAGDSLYTKFQITPRVRVLGDGIGAYAFPVLNSEKKITGINLVNGGEDYTQANAIVTTPISATRVQPTLAPVLSPKGGHGSNILKEFNVKDIIVVIEITEDDDKFVGGGNYRQFGIIKNPQLNNGSGEVAGTNDPYYTDITLLYDGVFTNRTLAEWKLNANGFAGDSKNFLIGTESSVGSKIVELKSVTTLNSERRLVAKVTNVGGKYISYQNRPDDYIIKVSSLSAANKYIVGETITQSIPAGTAFNPSNPGLSYGYNINTTGVLLSKSSDKLTIRTLSNGFVTGTQQLIGSVSGATALATTVSPRYGEYAYPYSSASSSFVNESGNYDLFRVVDIGTPYFDLNQTPSFTGLTVLEISSSVSGTTGSVDTTSNALSPNSFFKDDFIQQGISGDSLQGYASGYVYDWNYINQSRGELYLTNVLGNFKNVATDGLTGSTLGSFIVSSVTEPEIKPNSGEIIYINNMRPISRVAGQEEEFRLRLGF